jgi:hypothetical protein
LIQKLVAVFQTNNNLLPRKIMKTIKDFNLIASLIEKERASPGIGTMETATPELGYFMRQVCDVLDNYQDAAIEVPFAVHERVLKKFCNEGLH